MRIAYDSKKKELTIVVEIDEKGRTSASGKSLLHFTTGGNTPISVDGKVMKLGINLYSQP